ncbi:MAG TPA: pyridoxamine 5'-phosphate oxidase family protein, partial [Dehalococcoidia bacterium]|nr:pyridoxamine 5'-phosphate oxidase family protein [Dehalococcoidia bacterium]
MLTPIWYLYRDGLLYMRSGEASLKAMNVRRDPRVTVCVQDERPPYRSVTVYGRASLEREEERLGAAIARRYLGAVAGA